MVYDVSSNNMYKIINKAIRECYNHKNEQVNNDIKIFQEKHWKYIKTNPQLNIFSDHIPNLREVAKAVEFCDLLDDFRISVDVYNDNAEDLSELAYKNIYKSLDYYRPYIEDDNKENFNILENTIKKHIPEYNEGAILDEYAKRAQNLVRMKKETSKNKTVSSTPKVYERLSLSFFEDVEKNQVLKNTKSSVKKLSAYSNILNAVDCLSDKEYGRIKKYKLKIRLNQTISSICKDLGPTYFLAKENADTSIQKYQNAIENAQKYKKSKKTSIFAKEIINKRLREEYLYK